MDEAFFNSFNREESTSTCVWDDQFVVQVYEMLLNHATEGKFENDNTKDIELTIRVSAIEAQHRLGETKFHEYNVKGWKRQIDGFLMDIYLGLGNSTLSSLVCDESISQLKSYILNHGGPDACQNLEMAMKENPLLLKLLRNKNLR